MELTFEDAVDEILTGKRRTRTEASLHERLKTQVDETDVNKILSEEEPKKNRDEEDLGSSQDMKDRMSDKEEEVDIDDDEEDAEDKDEEEKNKQEKVKKEKKEFLENLKRDNVLKDDFPGLKYKVTKNLQDLDREVLRTYVRINSKNINIKRFGLSEIVQFGDLKSILAKYSLSIDELSASSVPDQGDGSDVDSAMQQAASPTGMAQPKPENSKVYDSLKIILKRVSDQTSSLKLVLAFSKNDIDGTISTTVLSPAGIRPYDSLENALTFIDQQYQSMILADISNNPGSSV